MIEIKRKCSSSIRNDPVKKQITFGDFTLRITEEDWDQWDLILQDCKLSPVEALEELIYAALDLYNTKLVRKQCEDCRYGGEGCL